MTKELKLYVVRVVCIYVLIAVLYNVKMEVPIHGVHKVLAVYLSMFLSLIDTLYRLYKKKKEDMEKEERLSDKISEKIFAKEQFKGDVNLKVKEEDRDLALGSDDVREFRPDESRSSADKTKG